MKNISLENWKKLEKFRQIQKTLQNEVGNFHQQILGHVDGWLDLGVGNVVDLVSVKRKIIVEVKNKHNTTKGNHKPAIYDNFKTLLDGKYRGYTAYYVEVIPSIPKQYNKIFVPSDNNTHSRRTKNDKIRVIDGKSFYGLATSDEHALIKLYEALPKVIFKILKKPDHITKDRLFLDLYFKTFLK